MPTSSDIPAINIQNLSKSYRLSNKKGNKVKALDNVTLKINQGEVVGIIGPNGSGKSTLLKVLSEITAPDSGTIKIHGKIASILEVGTGFNPDLSGRKNIYLNARLHGMKKKEVNEKLDSIVKLFGFPRFLDMPVKQYSSGMYMRLAFAVVVHIDADIYLFDEVMSVGDLEFQGKSVEIIKSLNARGKTVVIVTHAPARIAGIVDEFVMFENGRIIQEGPPDEVMLEWRKKGSHGASLVMEADQEIIEKKRRDFLKNSDAPKVLSIKIHPAPDHGNPLDAASEHKIEMKLFASHDNSCRTGIYLKDADSDQTLLSVMDSVRNYESGKSYQLIFSFPAGYLNEAYLKLGVFYANKQKVLTQYADLLQFQVTNSEKLPVRKIMGSITPNVPTHWKMT